jgi:hypothetical protein
MRYLLMQYPYILAQECVNTVEGKTKPSRIEKAQTGSLNCAHIQRIGGERESSNKARGVYIQRSTIDGIAL